MSLTSIVSLIAAFAVTLGALMLAMRLLKRMHGGASGLKRGVTIQVIQRVAFGPKQSIALVRIGERVLVVSVADGGLHLLTELGGAELENALRPASPVRPGMVFSLPVLGRLMLLACALALAPAAAHAQAATATTPPRTTVGSPARPTTPPAARGTTAMPGGAQPAPGAATVRPLVGSAVAAGSPPPAPGPTLSAPAPSPMLTIPAPLPPHVDITLGEGASALHLSGAVGLVVFLGLLTLLPALFLLMTSFTRILIVLHFLRSAVGTQTAPPSQLLAALAVLLTGVVMNPVLQQTNRVAIQPYMHGQITQTEAYGRALQPFREFMLNNTRGKDLTMFTQLSGVRDAKSVDDVPIVTVMSAFVTSELRTAFQMGFVIFLPFVVVDVIVASVLMSLGMFMLPPAMISLPFKLLLFVLADGWVLVVQNLVTSFR